MALCLSLFMLGEEAQKEFKKNCTIMGDRLLKVQKMNSKFLDIVPRINH